MATKRPARDSERELGYELLEYCHPLTLQALSPKRLMLKVNAILRGDLKLLIQRPIIPKSPD